MGAVKTTRIEILLNIIFQAFMLDRETKIVHDTFAREAHTVKTSLRTNKTKRMS